MKLSKVPRAHVVGFWLSMPFISLALCYIMYDEQLFRDWRVAAIAYPVIYAIGYVSWRIHAEYDAMLRRRFPGVDQTKSRLLFKTVVNIVVMTPSVLVIFFVFHWLQIAGYRIQSNDLLYGYLVGLSVNILFESLWEVLYLVEKFKESAYEKELLERMQLMQEFEILKQKVNPHFLFNCFNTLLALIHENKQQAECFLDELSKVYRYLLRNNESGMSTLQQELAFINSYSTLLKTRHGEGFRVRMDIDAGVLSSELPSLSLQMLVENAVKHNVISKENPIEVVIRSLPAGKLVVENNLVKKLKKADSTGIGLTNIREKYKLLDNAEVLIEETADRFRVTLPLLPVKERAGSLL
jgi:sensor histidine kinase YesM